MKDTDAAWLAGFIDGEGCVQLTPARQPKKTYYSVRIMIRHTDSVTVDRLVKILDEDFGLTVHITHEIRPLTHKDSMVLGVQNVRDVLKVAKAIRPYAITKRHQLDVVIEWCERRIARLPHDENDERLIKAGSTMNRRGKGHK